MVTTVSKLTILFKEPFWVGICERHCENKYEVCKITFGAEPKDYEVYEFMLKNYEKLQFSPSLETTSIVEKSMNPKRMQRAIKKQLQETGMGTKAQQALKLQQEQGKLERKIRSREKREQEDQRKLQLRIEKRKQKHKGH